MARSPQAGLFPLPIPCVPAAAARARARTEEPGLIKGSQRGARSTPRRALRGPCRARAQCGPLPAPCPSAPPPLRLPARPRLGCAPSPSSQPPLCPAAASRVSGSMFSWVSKDARRKKEPELFQTVAEGLRQLYAQKLLPLEEHYRFHEFHSPALEDADFDNKPMVLLVGQYSTGKTTFIRHLIEQDFPGMRIGPEPTTDSFIAVMHGPTEGMVPGNALVVDPRRPFRKLNAFGNAFLNRYPSLALGGTTRARVPTLPRPPPRRPLSTRPGRDPSATSLWDRVPCRFAQKSHPWVWEWASLATLEFSRISV